MDETKKFASFKALPVAVPLATMMAATPAFAEGPTATAVTATDWASVITALTGQVSVSTVVAALATFVGAGVGLVFMWWGVRKGIRSLMAAFRGGKLRI